MGSVGSVKSFCSKSVKYSLIIIKHLMYRKSIGLKSESNTNTNPIELSLEILTGLVFLVKLLFVGDFINYLVETIIYYISSLFLYIFYCCQKPSRLFTITRKLCKTLKEAKRLTKCKSQGRFNNCLRHLWSWR